MRFEDATALLHSAFDLRGRVAIVTGAAGGIGRAGAALLGAAGAHVVVADNRGDAATRTADELAAQGMGCEAAQLDVTDSSAVDDLVAQVFRGRGRLDVMVNNAGTIDDTTPLSVGEADLDRVHAVNFKGVVFGSQAAARVMIGQRSGAIVNVTSAAVDMAAAKVVAYSTAKAAAAQYSRSLAVELGPHGVRVNVVSPGWVETPMTRRHYEGSEGDERRRIHLEQRAKSSPLGLVGRPEDQALAMLYLASDAARFVTGTVLRVNGGATMPW